MTAIQDVEYFNLKANPLNIICYTNFKVGEKI